MVYVFMNFKFLNQYPHITWNLEIRERQKKIAMIHHLGVFLPLCRDIFDSYQVKHIKLGLFISSLPQTLSFGGRYYYNQSLQMSNVSLSKWTIIG